MCIEYGYSSVCESMIKGDTPTLDIFFVLVVPLFEQASFSTCLSGRIRDDDFNEISDPLTS